MKSNKSQFRISEWRPWPKAPFVSSQLIDSRFCNAASKWSFCFLRFTESIVIHSTKKKTIVKTIAVDTTAPVITSDMRNTPNAQAIKKVIEPTVRSASGMLKRFPLLSYYDKESITIISTIALHTKCERTKFYPLILALNCWSVRPIQCIT